MNIIKKPIVVIIRHGKEIRIVPIAFFASGRLVGMNNNGAKIKIIKVTKAKYTTMLIKIKKVAGMVVN